MPVWALDPVEPLKAGQWQLGMYAVTSFHANMVAGAMDTTSATPYLYLVNESVKCEPGNFGVVSASVGLTDWASVGLRLEPYTMLSRYISRTSYTTSVDLFGRVDLPRLGLWRFRASTEWYFSPLIMDPSYDTLVIRDGYTYAFHSLGATVPLTGNSRARLSGFMNLTLENCIPQERYGKIFSQLFEAFYGMTAEEVSDAGIHLVNSNWVQAQIGLDFTYRGWTLDLNYCVPFFYFAVGDRINYHAWFCYDYEGLSLLENLLTFMGVSLSYRFSAGSGMAR